MSCSLLFQAGLTQAVIRELEQILIGCGGLVKELIRRSRGASTLKDDNGQRLSAADELADQFLREHLLRLVPSSTGYSEEGHEWGPATGSRPRRLRVRWLVDPVDGTRPATLGGAFAVCVGAVVLREETPVAAAGWVYCPTLPALYSGWVTADGRDSRLDRQPAAAERNLSVKELRNRYVAASSDWRTDMLPGSPMKLTGPGAAAVHLVQLVHPGSDVAAVALTRYKPYDAAAALCVAVAGGSEVYSMSPGPALRTRLDLLSFLAAGAAAPGEYAQPILVCTPEVAGLLAG